MIPAKIGHPQETTALGYTHSDPTIGEIVDLPILKEPNVIWSRWHPSRREKLAMILGCDVWLGVCSQRQPPVYVFAAEDPGYTDNRGTVGRLRIHGCPTFEHWLECGLYRTLLVAAARLGLITVAENSVVRLDWKTIMREESDSHAFAGPPFCRTRWLSAWYAIADRFTGRKYSACHHPSSGGSPRR